MVILSEFECVIVRGHRLLLINHLIYLKFRTQTPPVGLEASECVFSNGFLQVNEHIMAPSLPPSQRRDAYPFSDLKFLLLPLQLLPEKRLPGWKSSLPPTDEIFKFILQHALLELLLERLRILTSDCGTHNSASPSAFVMIHMEWEIRGSD